MIDRKFAPDVDRIAEAVRLDRDRVQDVLDASGRMQERRGEAEMTDQSLREQVAEALGDAHSENRDPDIEINFSSLADAAIAASGVEGLQRSNDGLLDAIERLNEGQDRLRVENEQLRQLLDLPVGEQRAAVAAYREHEQGSAETLAEARGFLREAARFVGARQPLDYDDECAADQLRIRMEAFLAVGEGER